MPRMPDVGHVGSVKDKVVGRSPLLLSRLSQSNDVRHLDFS